MYVSCRREKGLPNIQPHADPATCSVVSQSTYLYLAAIFTHGLLPVARLGLVGLVMGRMGLIYLSDGTDAAPWDNVGSVTGLLGSVGESRWPPVRIRQFGGNEI